MRGFFIIEITINLIQRNLNFLAEILPVFNKSSKKYTCLRGRKGEK